LGHDVTGTVLQINISPGGIPKRPVREAMLTPLGVGGDAWSHPNIHGGPDKAVLLLDSETIETLAARGYPVFPGALGENLTTRGLDRRLLRLGQEIRVGGALIELTRVRVPCATLDIYGRDIGQEIYDSAAGSGDPRSACWGMSGFYARVIRPGMVHTDDIISVVATLA
jgi:MOSC domain-containing protein YiiM